MMMLFLTLLTICATIILPLPNQVLAQHEHDTTLASISSNDNNHQQYKTAKEIISLLGLIPNVEGGYYIETFRDEELVPGTNRSVGTAIYYLLEGPDVPSVWHRVDAAEVWHWYAGAPLTLQIANGKGKGNFSLGNDFKRGLRPQVVVPRDQWQRAISWGAWTLVGTTVAPAFVPEGYELAPPGWEPNS